MPLHKILQATLIALSMGLILGVFVFQAEIALRDSIGSKQWVSHRQIAYGYGEASSTPASSSVAPVSSSVAPVSSSVAPDSSSAVPNSSSIAPASSSVAPDSSSAAPASSSAVPASSSVAPDSSSAAPESSSVVPDSSSTAPDSSSAIPDSSSAAPDPSSTPPVSSSAVPNSSSVVPVSSSAVPDSSSAAPDSSSALSVSSSIPSTPIVSSAVATGGGGGIAGGYTFTPFPVIPLKNIKAGCGNGIWEPGLKEECDAGRLNGTSPSCSITCKKIFCGDGIVQPEVEECEPDRAGNGSYVLPICGGRLCLPPTCDATGCFGGCRWVFSPKCAPGQQALVPSLSPSGFLASLLQEDSEPILPDASDQEDNSWLASLLESVLDAIDVFLNVMLGK